MNRVMVSTASDGFLRRVRLAIGADTVEQIGVTAPSDLARLMVELLTGEPPEVVVFGPGVATDAALTLAAHLGERSPATSVVLATGVGPDEWLEAMRAGIRDVIDPDADIADLRMVLERAAATAAARRQSISPSEGGQMLGRVIPVASPKGGCGKTTVSTNLAVGLAKLAPHQTVIVDLDLQFGDVATALQMTPSQGLSDALRSRHLDAMGLKTFLTPHPTGVYALCAPASPAFADSITGDDVANLINLLANEFRYVVIDTAPGLSEHTLAVFDQASDAVMVGGMDVPSIRGLAKEMDILRQLSLTRMNQHVVMNFADKRSGLTVKDVETVIGTTVDIALPRSKSVPLSTNRGVPLLQTGTRDPVARELNRLVARFQPQLKKAVRNQPRHRAWAR
jgi:pilus assembly protein CpaE